MIQDARERVWISGGLYKRKRWNFWQRQRERHLDDYSWVLQVCQALAECQRLVNEGRAWSNSSESAASKHTYSPCSRGLFHLLFKVTLNQPFHGSKKGTYWLKLKGANLPLQPSSNCICLFPGRSESITDCVSSSRCQQQLQRSTATTLSS